MNPLPPIRTPRYLANFDTRKLPSLFTDTLVVGSGVAGLSAAIGAAKAGTVIVATKADAGECNTQYAQGGVAAVMSATDSAESHITDTLKAGGGLCVEPAVRKAVADAPRRVQKLIDWGALFDGPPGTPRLAQEGGHSAPRILHADGDATGKEIERTLLHASAQGGPITILEHAFVVDLLTKEGVCRGALIHANAGGFIAVWAQKTVLASGGAARLYRETTNPEVATGDGVAIAYRAGAAIENIEFIQFHPTTLYIAGACRFLLSEAMRGEGARLTDKHGTPFMQNYHPDADLAPRDVVARAIIAEMSRTGKAHVYLNLTHLDAEQMRKRFPAIVALVESYDFDISRDPIPVHPSAHYMIGGILTDLLGRTTVPNLYAVGEVASTGMHGANRLGSNSLLEGLVFGAEAGEHIAETLTVEEEKPTPIVGLLPEPPHPPIDTADLTNSIRALMWRQVGIVRTQTSLESATNALAHWTHHTMQHAFNAREGWQLQDASTLASLITQAALSRQETRGVHYREDFPDPVAALARPSVVWREQSEPIPTREAIDWS